MKKFLSLVLALVMTMSLVTVSAGAKEFKDDKDVTYDEAVAVISEIGVVDGDTDGNFRPTDNLSRGAAAKIICNLILGPTTAAELKADTAPFKDVPVSNTFSGYIAYCAKEGIISGYADGTFRPAGTLTGYAFMKMLLGALGYDSENEGYTGANWSINVAKQAIGIGLNAGLADEFNGVDFVTREEAALYAFNTLKATMVDYEQKITTNINGVEVVISQGNEKPVTWTEGKNNDGNIKDDGFVQFAEEFFPKLVRKDDSTKFMAPANTWVYDKTEIGTYERTDLIVETYTTGVTGKDVYDLLKSGVIKDNDLEVYEDGKDLYGEKKDDKVGKDDLVRSNNSDLVTTGNGALTKVYLDTDEDKITIVTINNYLAKAAADYSESKEYAPLGVYLENSNAVTFNVDVEDVANVANVKEDTFYQVTVSYKDSERGEVVTINDVEVLEDSTVTKFSTSKNDDETSSTVSKLTTGGEEYKANVKAFYDKDILNLYDEDLLTGKTYNVYVDSNGYFLGVDLFEGTKNYVFITGYDRPTSNLSIKTADAAGIFLDGTMKTIKVDVSDTNDNIDAAKKENKDNASYFEQWTTGTGEHTHNRWYTYTEADGVYTLKPAVRMTATTSTKTSNNVIRTDALSLVDDISRNNRVYGEDATVFLTVDTGKVDDGTKDAITEVSGVYTGVQSVEIEVDLAAAVKPHIYTVYDSDHYVIGAVVLGESIGSNQNLAYILSGAKSEELKDGVYYWEFECVMNGELKTLTAKSKYKSTITTLKNSIDEVVELRFDGDYVVDVKDDVELYTNTSKHIDGEAAYYLAGLKDTENTLSYQGGTMYVRNDRYNDVGLGIAKDAKAVVIQKENNKEKKTEFTSVEAAIAHLADPDNNSANGKQYKGIIAAGLNANGTAAWVVFDSATPLTSGSGNGDPIVPGDDSSVDMTAPGKFTVSISRNHANGTTKTPAEITSEVTQIMERYTGMKVKSYNYAVGNTMIFDDGSTWGTSAEITVKFVRAVYLDGQFFNNISTADNKVFGLEKNAFYLIGATYGSAATQADSNGDLSVTAGDSDLKLYTAYKVEATNNGDGSARTTISYQDVDGKTQNYTQTDGAMYFAKGTTLTVTGQAATIDWKDGDDKHATLRYFENNVTHEKLNDYQMVLDTDKASGTKNGAVSMTYTVSKDIQISESTDFVEVIIDGSSYGYRALYQNGSVAFNAPATAKFARQVKLDAGTAALLKEWDGSKGNIVNNSNGTFSYKLDRADHADENGVIELTQAANVSAPSSGITVKHNGAALTAAKVVAVGDVLTVTGATKVTVNGTSTETLTPDSNGVVTYEIKAGTNSVSFSAT